MCSLSPRCVVSISHSAHSGHIPRELQALAQGAQLNVNLVDKSHEDYTPPKVVVKPFAGAGNKLGNTPYASACIVAVAPLTRDACTHHKTTHTHSTYNTLTIHTPWASQLY